MRSDYPAEIEVESNEGQNVRYRLAPEFFARSSKGPRHRANGSCKGLMTISRYFSSGVFEAHSRGRHLAGLSRAASGNVCYSYRPLVGPLRGRDRCRPEARKGGQSRMQLRGIAGLDSEWCLGASKFGQGGRRLGCGGGSTKIARRPACRASNAIIFGTEKPAVSFRT